MIVRFSINENSRPWLLADRNLNLGYPGVCLHEMGTDRFSEVFWRVQVVAVGYTVNNILLGIGSHNFLVRPFGP